MSRLLDVLGTGFGLSEDIARVVEDGEHPLALLILADALLGAHDSARPQPTQALPSVARIDRGVLQAYPRRPPAQRRHAAMALEARGPVGDALSTSELQHTRRSRRRRVVAAHAFFDEAATLLLARCSAATSGSADEPMEVAPTRDHRAFLALGAADGAQLATARLASAQGLPIRVVAGEASSLRYGELDLDVLKTTSRRRAVAQGGRQTQGWGRRGAAVVPLQGTRSG